MKRSALCILVLAIAAPAANAYRVSTHDNMTASAVATSRLGARIPELGASMGVVALDSAFSDGSTFSYYGYAFESRWTVLDLLRYGAIQEDDRCCARFKNHFFNPIAPAGSEGYLGGIGGRSSRDWGLEPTPIFTQDFSLRDARDYLRLAIRGPDERARKRNLHLMLRSLGHVVHLVQDLGQPQHTRNDSHALGSGFENHAYENPGVVLGSYGPVTFPDPGQFWTGGGQGLADYSNREFVTAGTNFSGRRSGNVFTVTNDPRFPSPSGASTSVEKLQITDLLGPVGPGQPLLGEMWFVTRPVNDLNAGGTTAPVRLSTFSIFDDDLELAGFDWTMTLNRFNYRETQALLGPRAIGYSTGLIDRFLRGKISISTPSSGLYAWADHASETGFSKLRLKLQNDTPGEGLGGGIAVAVVKYHVNGCYQPDLTGEFKPDLVPPCPSYRSATESMTISDPRALTLGAGASTELTFNFPTPIPMSATDVFVQILYDGAVGTEAAGIAFGAADVSEPTFIAIFNGTDAFEIPGGFFLTDEIIANIAQSPYSYVDRDNPPNQAYNSPPDLDIIGGNIRYELVFPNNTRIATFSAVPKGRFSRVAVLMGTATVPYVLRSLGAGFNQQNTFNARPKTLQLDLASNTFQVSTVHQTRDTPQWASVLSYRYHPTPVADLATFPLSKDEQARTPVAATMDPMP